MDKWWLHTVFYQIYMPCFCDENGNNGFRGIKGKLPYLKELGVGGIWLTPFYPSPGVDNGYDVSDYYGINPLYGDMEEFEGMLYKAHELGIRVIADVVVNHTSSLHPWFIESASSLGNEKRDWYIWRDPVSQKEPNNWKSFFGGSAWELQPETGQYYYHSFAREQVDLNWRNPQVKNAVFDMLKFWLDKGIDGFRFDVINNLTVSGEFLNNPLSKSGEQLHENDVNQQGIHKALKEICQKVKAEKPDAFLVGEISSDCLDTIHSYLGEGELDTTFNFNLGSKETFSFPQIWKELEEMRALYGGEKNPTLFFGSHDMGRFPTRFSFGEEQVKCLLTLMLVYRGIPFLYYGDELGMKNRVCRTIEDAMDIQGILAYERALKEGKSQEEAICILNEKSRDGSRNAMDWEEASRQREDASSIWNYTKNLIKLRKSRSELEVGSLNLCQPQEQVLWIERDWDGSGTGAAINFSDREVSLQLPQCERLLLVSRQDIQKTEDGLFVLPPKSCAVLDKKLRGL